MQKLKLKDKVIVLTGKDNGKSGEIIKINEKSKKVLVKGVNVVKKNVKATQENPAGGIVEREAWIHRSNVAIASPKTGKPTRVRIESKDGKNIRVAVACGSELS